MSIMIGLILIWFVCCIPFVMLGVPSEASVILGAIAAIFVIVYLANKPDNESSHQTTTQRPVQRSGSSYSVFDNDDDDIDKMVMMDMVDGKLDGEFDFFDKD